MIGTAALDKIWLRTTLFNWSPYDGLWEKPSYRVKGEAIGYSQYQQPKGAKDYALDIIKRQEDWELYVRLNPSKVDPAEVQKRIKQDTGVIFDLENSSVSRCDIERTGQARYPVSAFHSVIEAATGRKAKRGIYQDTITMRNSIRQLQMYDKGKEQKMNVINYLRLEARLLKTTACQMAGINTVQDLLECDPAELYRMETARMLPYLDSLNKEDYNHAATLYERYAHLVNDAGNEGFLRKVLELEGLYNTPESVMFAFIDALPVQSYKKNKKRKIVYRIKS